MPDQAKTKKQLIDELTEVRQRIVQLQTSETEQKIAEGIQLNNAKK